MSKTNTFARGARSDDSKQLISSQYGYLDFLAGDKADGLGATIFLSAFFFFFSFFFGLLSPMAIPPVQYT